MQNEEVRELPSCYVDFFLLSFCFPSCTFVSFVVKGFELLGIKKIAVILHSDFCVLTWLELSGVLAPGSGSLRAPAQPGNRGLPRRRGPSRESGLRRRFEINRANLSGTYRGNKVSSKGLRSGNSVRFGPGRVPGRQDPGGGF